MTPQTPDESVPLRIVADEPAAVDKLDRLGLVQTAAKLVRDCDTPLVLGVYGSWGSGKTTFLRQMKKILDAQGGPGEPVGPPRPPVKTVWFDAWRHQFDDEPVLGLLHCIKKDLHIKDREFKKLIMEVGFALVADLKVPYTPLSLGAIRSGADKVRAAQYRQQEQRAALRDHFERLIEKAQCATPRGRIQRLRERLQRLRERLPGHVKMARAEPARLVVLIDDLDRCRPDAAVRMLDGPELRASGDWVSVYNDDVVMPKSILR